MKCFKKTYSITLAMSLTAAAFTPVVAQADLSASLSVSNMYLWRGVSISNPSPQVAGSLDYAHDTGLYAGMWTSSEGLAGSSETNLYAGFGTELAGISFDLSVVEYLYPYQSGASEPTFDFSETILNLGYAGASFTAVFNNQDSETHYLTLGYSMGDFGITFGGWLFDSSVDNQEYSHVDLSYQATEELSFTFSQVFDSNEGQLGSYYGDATIDDDPLFQVSYTMTFEL